MNELLYFIRALEDGNWWDSRQRGTNEVKRGDVVVFEAEDDAAYFIEAERARALTDEEFEILESEGELAPLDAPKPEPKPKPKPAVKKAARKKTTDEAIEDAEVEAESDVQAET